MTAAANAKSVHNSESPWLLASALFPGGALKRILEESDKFIYFLIIYLSYLLPILQRSERWLASVQLNP